MKRIKKVSKRPAPRSIRRMFPQVKYIKDANSAIQVNVKKSDCTSATPLDPTECALAKAAKREYQADAAVIGLSSSYVIKGDTAIRYNSGESIACEIVSFDRHSDFAPGEYYLTPKSPSNRLDVKAKKRSGPSGENKTAKRKHHFSVKVRDLNDKNREA